MYLRASGRCCGRKVTENSVVAGKAGAARRWSGVARCDLARMVGRAEPRRRTKAWLSVGGRRGLCGGQSVARTWPEGKRRSGAAAGGRVHPRTRTGGILRLLQVFFEKSDNKVFPLIQRCILWIYIALIGASRPWPCGNPWVCYSRRG